MDTLLLVKLSPFLIAIFGVIMTVLGWSITRNIKTIDERQNLNDSEVKAIRQNYLGRFDEIRGLINEQDRKLDQRFLDLHVSVARVEEQVKTLFKNQ